MLLNNFPKDFLLNKTLNTNGHLSYYLLPQGSLSLADREDVKSFGAYIEEKYKQGEIVDIGCGIMEVPGYLINIKKPYNTFYGLDPIPDIKFEGVKVIGCCEYMPFQDESIDTLIYATSLDHVCNLKQTFKESYRVLKKNGKVIIWHWYNNTPMLNLLRKIMLFAMPKKRYYPYDNGVSFVVPSGAIDPYHKEYISPAKMERIAKSAGFTLEDTSTSGGSFNVPRNNYFVTFVK